MQSWNGLCMLSYLAFKMAPDFTIQMDTSGSWGCRAVLNKQWLHWQWPAVWNPMSIMAKELVPIVCSCAVWGTTIVQEAECDNSSLIVAINKGLSKDA